MNEMVITMIDLTKIKKQLKLPLQLHKKQFETNNIAI